MTRNEVRHIEDTIQIMEDMLCRHCRHHDGFSTYDYEVCHYCCHYSESKFEYKGE